MVERLLHRWPLKLLAAVSAYAIWLSVVSEGNIVRDLDIPLVVDPGTAWTFVAPPPKNVSVRVRGLETTMESIEPGGLTAEIALESGEIGERSVSLREARIRGLPRTVEVVRVQPDRITVSVDRRLRKFLRVQPVWSGSPPEGYRRYGWRAVPEKVEVEGPSSYVDELTSIPTNPISLSGETTQFHATTTAALDNDRIVVLDRRTLRVEVDIDEDPVERRFNGLPLIPVGTDHSVALDPARTTVVVSGPPEIVEELEPGQIRLIVDLANLEPGPQRQSVDLSVTFEGISPRERGRLTARPTRKTANVVLTARAAEDG